MLITSRGTLTTARGSSGDSTSGAGSVFVQHNRARQMQALGPGRYRLSLDRLPVSILQVDYDGAPLYEGQTPGFRWENDTHLELVLPGALYASDADIHVRMQL